MHQLSYLAIQNFRACKNVELPLESYTPLVGQNNTGKSTILAAIKWVLKPSTLSVSDFADSTQPVVVAACISGITEELLQRIPEQKHRTAIAPYCASGNLWIRVTASGTGKGSNKPEVYNHETYSGSDVPVDWRDYPTGLPQAVSALLPEPLHIEAMDDIGEDLGKAKAGTTIKELLDEIMEPVLKAHEDLNNALSTIRQILAVDGEQRSGHLKAFDEQATNTLGHFFPGLALDLDLQMVDVKEFFKAGDLHVTDKLTGDRRRFDQIGTGAQRAIQMALIRYLAQTRAAGVENPARRLLLIDEPELYLHPQGIRRLRQALHTLSSSGFQVVFSTHSPLMLNRDNAADTVIVKKCKDDGTTTQKPLRHAVVSALSEAESQSRTLFELGNLAEIYFSELVVLCEGKTDRRLLPIAYEQLYGQSPDLDNITFLSLGSCSDIPKALPVLSAMGIKSCAIADLDFAFTEARKGSNALLDKDGSDLNQAKAILQRIQSTHDFPLGDNGLPTKDKKTGWQAADSWALMAAETDGKLLANSAADGLKTHKIWIWAQGCIEHVTGATDKGEDAIIRQETELQKMTTEQIETQMPAFKECFEWIRSL